MTDRATASIIIPTYYRNDLLQSAIESALTQEYEPIEVIVVDDSGERYAKPVVDDYEGITYIALDENLGENPARDVGLDSASGRYVQFLDDDDLLREDKIRLQEQHLDDQTGVVYSGMQYHESGQVILPESDVKGDVLERALEFRMWPPCFTSAMLIDRDVLEQIRPLKFHGAGDTTFMIGLAQRTQFEFVDEPLVEKRHGDSLGFSLENVRNKKQLLNVYEDLYDQFPESRRSAKAHSFYQEGRIRLSESVWSPRAIAAFARAVYYSPSDRTEYARDFVGSFGGQPGLRAAGLAGWFGKSVREDGVSATLRKTTAYLRSR